VVACKHGLSKMLYKYGLSCKQLAHDAKIDPSNLSAYFAGRKTPTEKTIQKIYRSVTRLSGCEMLAIVTAHLVRPGTMFVGGKK